MDTVMGKRSNFIRNKHDLYDTPASAVDYLIPHLKGVKCFYEPCYGNGALAVALEERGIHLLEACEVQSASSFDARPYHTRCRVRYNRDAMEDWPHEQCDAVITNLPWTRNLLHPMILHFQKIAPTWLLFDADWAFTKQARPFIDQCSHFVSVGRLKWIPDSPHTGKDNAAWYRFHVQHTGGPKFINSDMDFSAPPSPTQRQEALL